MEDKKVQTEQKQIKEAKYLKTIQTFGKWIFPVLILSCILGLLAIFAGTEFYHAFHYGFGIGIFEGLVPVISTIVIISISLAVIIIPLSNIKSFIALVQMEKGEEHLKAAIYVRKMIEACFVVWFLVFMEVLYFSLFHGNENVSIWVVLLSVLGVIAAQVAEKFFWQTVYGKGYTAKFFIGLGLGFVKMALVIALLLVFMACDVLAPLKKGLGAWESNVRMFSKTYLYFEQVALKIGFMAFALSSILSVFIDDIEGEKEEEKDRGMKKYMIIAIVCIVVDCLLYVFLCDSSAWFTVSIGRWLEEARQWWIPVLLLFITFNLTSLFPTKEEILKDIKGLKKVDVGQAKQKMEGMEMQTEEE